MEPQELGRRVTKLQAWVRGRQTRRRLQSVKAEYEEVVRQLEGGPGGRLRWRGRWLPRPVFSPEPRRRNSGPREGGSGLGPVREAPNRLRGEEPERDGGWKEACPGKGPEQEAGPGPQRGLVMEAPTRDSEELTLPSQPAQLQRLRRHLAMEMLWLQQAIVSRKKAPPTLPGPNCRSPGRKIPASASCTVQVFRNGDLLSPPFSLHLSLTSRQDWGSVLRQLTEKVKLKDGPVSRLCTLEGMPVLGREALMNGGYYVAVSEDEYKALPYLELLVPSSSLPGGFWRPPRLEPRAYRQKTDTFRAPVAQLSWKESSVSFARPRLARPHLRRRSLLQPGERSVYGAPHARRELAGAQEVEENGTTLTEVPLDQRAAEMAEEAYFLENAA